MEYFELFGMPVTLQVDKSVLRKKYLELSRKYHPDYFVNGDAGAQQGALEAWALLNKALQTFSDPDKTIAYVLRQKGLLEEEEKYTLSPQFLMEMMELNEELDEADGEDVPTREGFIQKLREQEARMYAPVAPIIENYREGATSEQELLQVKDYYFRKKYLERLYRQLGGKL